MVTVIPFAGYIPSDKSAQTLPSAPYDVVSTEEARALAKTPDSIHYVNRAEISFPPEEHVDTYSEPVYAKGRDKLQEFIAKDYLVKDDEKHFYAYMQEKAGHKQVGFIGLTSVSDYEKGDIKKHEFTTEVKLKDRIRTVDIQNANVGPVYLAYRSFPELNAILEETIKAEPRIDIKCAECDSTRHVLWDIPAALNKTVVELFKKVPALYICDGHHRAESAFQVGKKRRDAAKEVKGDEPFNFFMSVIFPHDSLYISNYDRVLKKTDVSMEELMEGLSKHFTVEEIPKPAKEIVLDEATQIDPPHYAKPKARHTFSMYTRGKWYGLSMKHEVEDEDPVKLIDSQILTDTVLEPIFKVTNLRADPNLIFVGGSRGLQYIEKQCEIHKDTDAARHTFSMYTRGKWYGLSMKHEVEDEDPVKLIDSQILTDTVLEPIFKVTNLRADPNIIFVGGSRGLQYIEKQCEIHKDTDAVGFSIFPVSMTEVFSVADSGKVMPPKSTFLIPKLLTGLCIRLIEE
ncbi:Uncharacterised conserved protein UCP033563 like protein [Aduncisulcus paluster]|uniref:Uncharacterized conserved protein UCP033563 like protein n=1 Tax=Aduncisulcus paluster TaxID=2918883 RepID=A0ABQ5K6Z7_9EUKA|nr:Uncharacterised conserved protein UCP033563 like protein [Aduncisulcus paluster]